jgi:predicted nucleic acid-binding Zn ribbon protein
MPIYVYETTDDKPVRRFEVQQSMKDEALRADPETGRPVRRVISGGYGVMQKPGSNNTPIQQSGSCGTDCGCH